MNRLQGKAAAGVVVGQATELPSLYALWKDNKDNKDGMKKLNAARKMGHVSNSSSEKA